MLIKKGVIQSDLAISKEDFVRNLLEGEIARKDIINL